MNNYQYTTSQLLPIDINKAWSFFSSPDNLPLITPPDLSFKILTPLNKEEISEGLIIDYTVAPLFGIPLRWQSKIGKIQKQNYFIDLQIKGPYKLWEHKHFFTEYRNGVLMKDEVNYQLPLGFIGIMMHGLLVRKKIENIFAYRRQILEKMFISNENNTN